MKHSGIRRLLWARHGIYIACAIAMNGCATAQRNPSTTSVLEEQRALLDELKSRQTANSTSSGDMVKATAQDDNLSIGTDLPRQPKKRLPPARPNSTNKFAAFSNERLLEEIHFNDIRLQEIYGPESEVNPRKPDACKLVNGLLGQPSAALLDKLLPSVGLLADVSRIARQSDGSFRVNSEQHGQAEHLCPGVCFADHYRYQSGAAYGSCFVVSSNLVLTARHVVDEAKVHGVSLAVILNFNCDGSQAKVERISATNYYEIVDYPLQSPDNNAGDWIFARLARPTAAAALQFSSDKPITNETVFLLGHPYGLPAIAAGDAIITKLNAAFFYASLDASAGDSGAPVFDSSGKVLGVFKQGGDDYQVSPMNPDCRTNQVIVNPRAPGQTVTSIFAIPSFPP